jgi:hypothetical protein
MDPKTHHRPRKAIPLNDSEALSPRRRRQWQQDNLREDDDMRMQNIVKDLRVSNISTLKSRYCSKFILPV